MLTYYSDAMTSTIIPLFKNIHSENVRLYLLLMVLCASIMGVWTMAQSIYEQKPLPWMQMLANLIIVVVVWIGFGAFLTFSVSLFNYLADRLFDVDDVLDMIAMMWGSTLEKRTGQNIFTINLQNLAAAVAGFFGLIAFYVLGLWRYLILTTYYVLSPYIITKSLIPGYGLRSLIPVLKDIIQLASWPLFHSALNLIVYQIQTTMNVYESNSVSEVYWYVTLNVAYVMGVKFIPKFASFLFGGTDYSTLTALTSAGIGLLSRRVMMFTKEAPEKAMSGVSHLGKGIDKIQGVRDAKKLDEIERVRQSCF